MVISVVSLLSEMVFSPLWFSRYNHIDVVASGSAVFPCPDTKGMDWAMEVALGGEVTSQLCFSAMLKPHFLLTDFFNLLL